MKLDPLDKLVLILSTILVLALIALFLVYGSGR